MTNALFWLVPISSVLALLFAWYFYKQLMKTDEGTPQMKKIALYVRRGAMSYLRQQYKVVGLVFLVLVILFSIMAFGFGVLRLIGVFGNEDSHLRICSNG